MDISVVIPLYNEEESLPELQAWIQHVMNTNGFNYLVFNLRHANSPYYLKVIILNIYLCKSSQCLLI